MAIPVEPAPAESAEYRKQLAESYGFRKIGEDLPDSVTLKDVISSLPKKVIFLKIYVMYDSSIFMPIISSAHCEKENLSRSMYDSYIFMPLHI